MSPAPCPRLFQVEAARDGRLTGAELANFERHMTCCPACVREAKALDGLADALRAPRDDIRGEDVLHARRERTRLLAAFDRALVAPEHGLGARRWLQLSAAAAAALVAAWIVLRGVRTPPQPVRSSAIVHADSAAVWSERRNGNREVIDLARGALWVHVDHSSGQERLLVVLPDGELEDTGTTFTVSAEDGHTTRVGVQEGHVVLRVRGQAAAAIGPGETWMPSAPPAAYASASAVRPADTLAAAPSDAVERTTPPPSLAAPAASAHASNASVDFRTAMTALDLGDNPQAAAAFASFLEKHSGDPRAEDASYLRVIALQRSGDRAGMRQAALEYLHRYPTGFRHSEVDPLSR
jgi:hypothetical protein